MSKILDFLISILDEQESLKNVDMKKYIFEIDFLSESYLFIQDELTKKALFKNGL